MAEATADDVITLVYTSGTTGPPKGAMLTNANFAFCDRACSSVARRGCPTAGRPNPTTSSSPTSRCATSPSGSSRRGTSVSVRCRAQLRRVDRDGHEQPPRGPADAVLRRAADLGEAARRRADQGQRRQPAQADDAPRSGCGRRARSAGRRSPTAATTRRSSRLRYAVLVPARAPAAARSASACAAAATRRRARHRSPRGARVLHRHRRPGVRALRHDRELGDRHGQLPRPDEARHGRRAVPRHRAAASTRRPARSRPSTPAASPATGASRTRRPRRSPTTAG